MLLHAVWLTKEKHLVHKHRSKGTDDLQTGSSIAPHAAHAVSTCRLNMRHERPAMAVPLRCTVGGSYTSP